MDYYYCITILFLWYFFLLYSSLLFVITNNTSGILFVIGRIRVHVPVDIIYLSRYNLN